MPPCLIGLEACGGAQISGVGSNATAGININAAATVFISDTIVSQNNVGIVLDGGAAVEIVRVKAIANSTIGILMSGTSDATTTAEVTETQSFGVQ